jgi:DNA-binding MurR/RpiR family transcriptional regulator
VSDGDVAGRIRSHLEQLSPNDRRVARHVLDNYAEAPFETAESLSKKTGVSKAAVVRFAVRVGFAGYAELHEALRTEAVARLAPAGSPQAGGDVIDAAVERARGDLAALRATADRGEFDAATASRRRWPSTPTTC